MKATATTLQLLAIAAAAFSGYIYYNAENRTDALEQTLGTVKEQLAQQSATNKQLKAENAALAKQANESRLALDEARSLNTVLTARSNQLKREANRYSDELDAKYKQEEQLHRRVADLKKEMADLRASTVSLSKVDAYEAEIAQLEQTILKLKNTERSFPGASATASLDANKPAKDLKGKILTVGPSSSFIVIDIGEEAGAQASNVLDVQRGGAKIAQVTITEVKENLSIAHVLPQSLISEPRSGDLVSTN